MSQSTTWSLKSFLQQAEENNPHQPEFLQTVTEIFTSLAPYVGKHLELTKWGLLERLVEPERVVAFRVSWLDDQGQVQVNRGYRVQFNSAIGPYKGGLRFHPSVNLSILKFLGFEQIFKNSLTGLPLGGGKGGSDFDPKGKSDGEVMRFCQAFMQELYRHIGSETDVPAGDIGVGGREIGYLYGQYKKLTQNFTGVLTGKGLSYGGSLIRPEATGYGVVYFAQAMLKQSGQMIEGKTCLVSGSGNVAIYTVEKLLELGARPVTMSDSSGTIYDASGITPEKLAYVKELKEVRRGRIEAYAKEYGAQFFPGEKPWKHTGDLAFPCATQNEITQADAKQLTKNNVLAIVEAANMPTTEKAIGHLQEHGVLLAPSKAANAGGVAVSGLEMSQNSQRLSWSREEVDQRLQQIMLNIHEQCVKYGKEGEQLSYINGANIAGFVKVAEAMKAQGVV